MLTLTTKELYELTGRSQTAAQLRWLNSREWIYELGLDGLPKVARAYFERRMVLGESIQPAEENTQAEKWEVNVSALRGNFTNSTDQHGTKTY